MGELQFLKLRFDLFKMSLGFLKTQNVRFLRINKILEPFLRASSDSVDIPGDDFHDVPRMSLSSKFAAHLCQQYPALQSENLESLISANMLSPHKMVLSESLRAQAQHTIAAFEALRNLPAYKKWVEQKWGTQFDP